MKTHNLVGIPVAETYAAPVRDSDERERGRSASGPQDRRFQRPVAFHPSSVPPGSLADRRVQRLQDASAVPYQVQGAQHLDVGRPLDDGPGVSRAAGCLDGRQTAAPSSLRTKSSRTRDLLWRKIAAATATARRPRKWERWRVARQRNDNRPLLVFRSGGPGDFGSS